MSVNSNAVEWAENVVKDPTHEYYATNSKHVIESLVAIIKANEELEIAKEPWKIIKDAEYMLENVAPQYFYAIGKKTVLLLMAALQKDETKLRAENDRLKKACRFMYLTLGYYGAPYNYDSKNWVSHPISGGLASGILSDGGSDARQASGVVKELFTQDEIDAW